MHRRTLLTCLAAVSASAAGCAGSGVGGSSEPLRYPDYSFESGPEGTTVVVLTVENPADERRSGTVVAKIHGREGKVLTAETDVSIPPGERETYRIGFDVEWAWFDENRNLQGVEFE